MHARVLHSHRSDVCASLQAAGAAATAAGSHAFIVIDAVNQLSAFNGAHSMDWFPTFVPAGVQAMASTTPESPCLTALCE